MLSGRSQQTHRWNIRPPPWLFLAPLNVSNPDYICIIYLSYMPGQFKCFKHDPFMKIDHIFKTSLIFELTPVAHRQKTYHINLSRPLLIKPVFSLLLNADKKSFFRSHLFTTNRVPYKLACIKVVSFKAVINRNNKLANLLLNWHVLILRLRGDQSHDNKCVFWHRDN